MRARLLTSVSFVGLVGACSWARFDDFQEDAPVLLLNKPGGVGYGFGSSLASVTTADGKYRVLAAASPGSVGAAEYEIGAGQGTSGDTSRTGFCTEGCTLGRSVAALRGPRFNNFNYPWCFALGFGSSPPLPDGILVQCEETPAFISVMALPAGVSVTGPEIVLASEDADGPLLLASALGQNQAEGRAWFYKTSIEDSPPVDLQPAITVDPSFGSALSVLHAQGSRWLAVGDPDQARVFLFDESGAVKRCLSGDTRFGRTLASGKVSGSADEELLVADAAGVHVLDGSQLLAGPTNCVAFPPAAEITTLGCRSTPDVSGCGGGEFGAALAVADLDHDGDGEVLVGAPGMTVREESSGGAIFVFDVEGAHPEWYSEAKFISSAESGDRLGASIAVVRQPDRDIFVGGAPGGGKAAVFFCPKLLPAGLRGSRCE